MNIIDSLAALLLTFVGLLPGIQTQPDFSNNPDWHQVQPWQEGAASDGHAYFEYIVSSQRVPELCRQSPRSYVVFPTVSQATHELRFDGHLAHTYGDREFLRTYAIYGSPVLQCSDLLDVQTLTWTVISHTKFFALVRFLPYVSNGLPWARFFHETLYAAAAGVTFILMLISLIVFGNKVSRTLSFRMMAASLASCVYFVCAFPAAWHLDMPLLTAHKYMIAFIWMSIWLINSIFYTRRLLPRWLFAAYSTSSVLTLITVIAGRSEETTHAGSMLSFATNVVVTLFVFIQLVRLFCQKRDQQNFLLLCSGSFFIFSVLNDIFLLLRMPIFPVMTMPIGMVAGQLLLLLSVNEEILATYQRNRDLEKSLALSEREKIAAQRKIEVNDALAKASQMLVHDVRKPFATLEMFMSLVTQAGNPAAVRQYATKYLPYIRSSMVSVNRMLDELSEIGKPVQLECQAINLSEIFVSSLQEVLRMCPSQRAFRTDFILRHIHKAYADPYQLGRVVCNIIQNAIEAADQLSYLSFTTSERRDDILVVIENDGSAIPPENISNVFGAFFTYGKRSGTGLGLAISQKIIGDHGGSIWCESDAEQQKVRFFFTLPKTKEVSQYIGDCPTGSLEVINQALDAGALRRSKFYDCQLKRLQKAFMQQLASKNRKYELALIDDDPIYIEFIYEIINSSQLLAGNVHLRTFQTVETFLAALDQQLAKIDLFICDVDLGHPELDGFAVTKAIRAKGLNSLICVHSNATTAVAYKRAIAAGADFYFIKPVQEVHVLKLLAAVP